MTHHLPLSRGTLALLSLLVTSCLALPAQATAQAKTDYTTFRKERQANLGRPDGLLSVVRFIGARPGTFSVGSAPDCSLQQDHLPAHAGTLVVAADLTAVLRQPDKEDQPLPSTKANDLQLSTDRGWAHLGPVSFANVPGKDHAALLIKDREAPAVLSYPGLRWFPPSATWRVVAQWVPYNTAHPLDIVLRNGTISHEPALGYAEFTLQGKQLRLEAVEDDEHLFFVIGDQTNEATSYGGGRFLEGLSASNGPAKPGTIVLDFNNLVNPYCAYSVGQNCPRPTKANTLPISILAGEMKFPAEPH